MYSVNPSLVELFRLRLLLLNCRGAKSYNLPVFSLSKSIKVIDIRDRLRVQDSGSGTCKGIILAILHSQSISHMFMIKIEMLIFVIYDLKINLV